MSRITLGELTECFGSLRTELQTRWVLQEDEFQSLARVAVVWPAGGGVRKATERVETKQDDKTQNFDEQGPRGPELAVGNRLWLNQVVK